tara:strand:+ start:490 stop:1155 length:666 start_codon:yes stop_codon:yes gene_type:complete
MKLLLENWRQYLKEEEGEAMLLYHATCSPPESFVKGIDPTRAKGYGQGEGFYFWTNKKLATKHAVDHLLQGKDKEEKADCSDGAYIIVSDEPVTPETFDVDYEVYAGGFVEFVVKNKEYFEPRKEEYYIKRIVDNGFSFFPEPVTRPRARKFIKIGSNIDRYRAVNISQMAKKLSTESPEMFERFEQEILPKASAIKYNGKEKIIPLRIEDLEGNVVWSRG